jgi:hypothetical protein
LRRWSKTSGVMEAAFGSSGWKVHGVRAPDAKPAFIRAERVQRTILEDASTELCALTHFQEHSAAR